MLDLLIQGATILDGTGAPRFTGDVAVKDGCITQVGKVGDPARQTVDAAGLALMPGIVDVHTHYDAQVTWDRRLSPSPALGVTTAVLGNCGFGIAPCPVPQRQTVLRNLSVVEGMDLAALENGVNWEAESFAGYLEQLRRIGPCANVAVLAQHSTIRSAVMGEEASTRAEPTPAEMAAMQSQVREAMQAGAIGFASSFSPNHAGWAGRPMPSTIAKDEELFAMLAPLKEAGRGIFVMATGPRGTTEYMEKVAAETGRPVFMVTVLTMFNDADPQKAMTYYERCAAARSRGNEVYIHTSCQPLSFDFTLAEPYLLYSHDAFDRIKAAKPEDRGAIYRDPAFRARLRDNLANPKQGILFYGDWNKIERDGKSIAVLAQQAGRDPLDYFFDLPLDQQLIGKLFQNNDAGVAPLLKHDQGVVALSDAGAHLIYFCDAGFGLHFLQHWVRETGAFTLEEGVRRLTSDPAAKYRIPGRGRIAAGAAADLLLFDPATVGVSTLRRAPDLPGGGTRMLRDPAGVHGVWVNGVQVHDGKNYLALRDRGPGRVLTDFSR
ncbi:MAG: amidohydrolase family protein [Proteobacteria bacterium]|nr:amidohydrolase family protein [Pseudomonadota bacterium]MDA0984081.1 amidohydrolase family protein [Pseudomonadota bacterium]